MYVIKELFCAILLGIIIICVVLIVTNIPSTIYINKNYNTEYSVLDITFNGEFIKEELLTRKVNIVKNKGEYDV